MKEPFNVATIASF